MGWQATNSQFPIPRSLRETRGKGEGGEIKKKKKN